MLHTLADTKLPHNIEWCYIVNAIIHGFGDANKKFHRLCRNICPVLKYMYMGMWWVLKDTFSVGIRDFNIIYTPERYIDNNNRRIIKAFNTTHILDVTLVLSS